MAVPSRAIVTVLAGDSRDYTALVRHAPATDVQQLAHHPSVWAIASLPLQVDWPLASGPVLIDSFGGKQPAGLSMIGEAPILAFRLEKFANDETGSILACPATRAMACAECRFRDLGS